MQNPFLAVVRDEVLQPLKVAKAAAYEIYAAAAR